MKTLSAEDHARLRREVEAEFPHDPMMQELHLIRLQRFHELGDLPVSEKLRLFLRSSQPKPA